jgi:hypothetical protein
MLIAFWMGVLITYQILGPRIAEDHFTLYSWGLALIAAVTTVLYIKRAVDRYQTGDYLED